jgi:hypothetical protein
MHPADLSYTDAADIELAVLIAYLDEVVYAVDRRDRERVALLLDETIATHLPREVREELTLFAGQSAAGFRAPIRFLRFRYRMLQLRAGEEPLGEVQLDLGLGRGSGWRGIASENHGEGDELDFR